MAEHYDLIVLGSGPAGEKGAARAAYEGKRVALVEMAHVLGGTATSSGIPTKALRETALAISGLRGRRITGLELSYAAELDMQTFMYQERQVQTAVQSRVALNLDSHGVRRYVGRASFADPHTIRVACDPGELTITGDVILIATGARPVRPAAFPWHHPRVYDATSIMGMHRLPRQLTVVGGGVVGCEFACLFAALGIPVTLIHSQEQLFPFVDHEIGALLQGAMGAMGVRLLLPERLTETLVAADGRELTVVLASGARLKTETLLVAVGRASNTDTLGLERAGVAVGPRGLIPVNEVYQTEVPHIYAAGDVIGFPALASTAMEQGRRAVTHAFKLAYRTDARDHVPYGIWTIPEISMVGATEQALRAAGTPIVVGRAHYSQNARGMVLADPVGMLKLIFSAADLTLLGIHIIGDDACELIGLGLLALETRATAHQLIDLCFNFPSLTEMYKYAAYDALGTYRAQGGAITGPQPDAGP
ncbi:MAG TPA: Si-specific NAD(P)(+) transhydrogenase [Chloroflexaceae bacterium]|nr:Si-specific NAD(P)(+) transhydrogenase [Chloroflexaceae bacterium]